MKKGIILISLLIINILLITSCAKNPTPLEEEAFKAEIIMKTIEYNPEEGKVKIKWDLENEESGNVIYEIYSKKKNETEYIKKDETTEKEYVDFEPYAGEVEYMVKAKESLKEITKNNEEKNKGAITLNDFIGVNAGAVKNFDHRFNNNKIYVNDGNKVEGIKMDLFTLMTIGRSYNIYDNKYIYLQENKASINGMGFNSIDKSIIHIYKINNKGKISEKNYIEINDIYTIFLGAFDNYLFISGFIIDKDDSGNDILSEKVLIYDLKENPETPKLIKELYFKDYQPYLIGKVEDDYYIMHTSPDNFIAFDFIDMDFNSEKEISLPFSITGDYAKEGNNFILKGLEFDENFEPIEKFYKFEVTKNFSENDLEEIYYESEEKTNIKWHALKNGNLYTIKDNKVYVYDNNFNKSEFISNINYDGVPNAIYMNIVDNYLFISIIYVGVDENSEMYVSKYYYYVYDIKTREKLFEESDDSENANEKYMNTSSVIFKYY